MSDQLKDLSFHPTATVSSSLSPHFRPASDLGRKIGGPQSWRGHTAEPYMGGGYMGGGLSLSSSSSTAFSAIFNILSIDDLRYKVVARQTADDRPLIQTRSQGWMPGKKMRRTTMVSRVRLKG